VPASSGSCLKTSQQRARMGCIRSKNKMADQQEPTKTLLTGQPEGKAAEVSTDKAEGKPVEMCEAEASLKKIFDDIDADENGTVSVVELAVALKNVDFDLAALLEAADMNSRFHVLDWLEANQESRISWDIFKSSLWSAFEIKTGSMALDLSTHARGLVVNRTTTDVELEMPDGSKVWRDVDEIRMATPEELPHASEALSVNAVGAPLGEGEIAGVPLDEAEITEVEAAQSPLCFNC